MGRKLTFFYKQDLRPVFSFKKVKLRSEIFISLALKFFKESGKNNGIFEIYLLDIQNMVDITNIFV